MKGIIWSILIFILLGSFLSNIYDKSYAYYEDKYGFGICKDIILTGREEYPLFGKYIFNDRLENKLFRCRYIRELCVTDLCKIYNIYNNNSLLISKASYFSNIDCPSGIFILEPPNYDQVGKNYLLCSTDILLDTFLSNSTKASSPESRPTSLSGFISELNWKCVYSPIIKIVAGTFK